MKIRTEFYNILTKAKDNEENLIFAINKIMPLINKLSIEDNAIDEDLKSHLIEYAIEIIKSENFADKLAEKNI